MPNKQDLCVRPYPRHIPQNLIQAVRSQKHRETWERFTGIYGHQCVKCGNTEDPQDLIPEIICLPSIPTDRLCFLRVQPMCEDCFRIFRYRQRWVDGPHWMCDLRPGGWVEVYDRLGIDSLNMLSAFPIKTNVPESEILNASKAKAFYIFE